MPLDNGPSNHSGFRSAPRTGHQWCVKWTEEKLIWVPTRRGGTKFLKLKEITVPEPGTNGDPDLLLTTESGKQFYIIFARHSVFQALDKPSLVWPVEAGQSGAFWVMGSS